MHLDDAPFEPSLLADFFRFAEGNEPEFMENISVNVSQYDIPNFLNLDVVLGCIPNGRFNGTELFDGSSCASSSPSSPRVDKQQARACLFNESHDSFVEIFLDTALNDVRTYCVLDHPGRHAQYKNWLASSCFDEISGRRITLKEESNRSFSRNVSLKTTAAVPLQNEVNSSLFCPSEVKAPQGKDWNSRISFSGNNLKCNMSNIGLFDNSSCDGTSEASLFFLWFAEYMNCLNSGKERSVLFSSLNSLQIPSIPNSLAGELNFSGNLMKNEDLQRIWKFLSSHRQMKIRKLNLSNNQDITLKGLIDMEISFFAYLHEVDLSNNLLGKKLTDFDDMGELLEKMVRAKVYSSRLHSSSEKDIKLFSLGHPLWLNLSGNFLSNFFMEISERVKRTEFFQVCFPEATGCTVNSSCRLYQNRDQTEIVHLVGLCSSQRQS